LPYEVRETAAFAELLQLLPALKRVRWWCALDDLTGVVHAIMAHGVLESLYIECEGCKMNVRILGQLKGQLKELLLSCDSCDIVVEPRHDAAEEFETREAFLTAQLSAMLPLTTVRIMESDGRRASSALSRHFLPALLEPWQAGSLGPLHNSGNPDVTAQLEQDQRLDAMLKGSAELYLRSDAAEQQGADVYKGLAAAELEARRHHHQATADLEGGGGAQAGSSESVPAHPTLEGQD
jgi:hypothetical protein